MKLIYTLAFVLSLSYSTVASAICYSEDLIGYWDFYQSDDGYAVQCSLRIDGKGTISLHRFGCKEGNEEAVTNVSGSATIDSYCHVTLEVRGNDGPVEITIQATLNRSRDTIHGILEEENGWAMGFTMVKFY